MNMYQTSLNTAQLGETGLEILTAASLELTDEDLAEIEGGTTA
jgi:bacteriocin-like protein